MDNLQLYHHVAQVLLEKAEAAVQFQKWEVGSCACRAWIASVQYSEGKSPDVHVCVCVGGERVSDRVERENEG